MAARASGSGTAWENSRRGVLALLWALGVLAILLDLLRVSRQTLDKMSSISEVAETVRELKSVDDEVRLQIRHDKGRSR